MVSEATLGAKQEKTQFFSLNPFEPVRTRSDPFEPEKKATFLPWVPVGVTVPTRTRSIGVQKAFKKRSKSDRYPFARRKNVAFFG